jgi:tRNA/tmRNA/rRNA uracil-C5-methylase (TrmA/RlmC/RlmD family)
VVILDPPRTGARDAVGLIIEDLKPARVVYVGCDPVTQARDVGTLRGAGFEVVSWEAIDLFPHTHHVESVMELRRPE